MREYFWRDYYKNDKVVPFRKTFDYTSLEVCVTSQDENHCVIEVNQRGSVMKLELERGGVCYLNGMNTGKEVWYSDIDFSMPYDEFGGISLVMRDGDYVSMRMDGAIESFYSVPFSELNTYMTPYVVRAKSQYRGDWYNTLRR